MWSLYLPGCERSGMRSMSTWAGKNPRVQPAGKSERRPRLRSIAAGVIILNPRPGDNGPGFVKRFTMKDQKRRADRIDRFQYLENSGCFFATAFIIILCGLAACKRCYQCTDTTRTVDRAGNEKPVQKDQYQYCDENKNGQSRSHTDEKGTWTQTKTECHE